MADEERIVHMEWEFAVRVTDEAKMWRTNPGFIQDEDGTPVGVMGFSFEQQAAVVMQLVASQAWEQLADVTGVGFVSGECRPSPLPDQSRG